MNPRRLERVPYNPLKNCSVVEVADALTNASGFTEPHYKYHLSAWVKVVCEVMALAGVHYSLDSILFFMDFDNFSTMLNKLIKSKDISAEKAEKYASYKDIAQIASTSRARFLNILLGEGKEVIGDYRNISAEDVRKENAVLFLDLDSFKYTDFTQIIGAFFINDMRHLISSEKDHSPKRIIMDELSCYVTEQIMPLFSQSRSFGYQLVVATQSIADIEQLNEKLAVRIMENCGQYGILQLNSADDAEAVSKIIGTTISVETTRKSTGTHLHPTADGSKKVVNVFKVTPDTIKELEPLEVIFYDKKQPHKIKRVKMEYGWEKPMGRGGRR